MSFSLKWESDGVRVTFNEDLDDKSYLNCNTAIISDQRFANIKYVICNYLNVKHFPLNSSSIQQAAIKSASAYKNNHNLKIAIITDKEVIYGLHNMFLAYFRMDMVNSNDWEFKVFKTANEAKEWAINT